MRSQIPQHHRKSTFPATARIVHHLLTYLPPYSPHLNIAETVWRKLKKEWLNPEDYPEKNKLLYATNRCLAALGTHVCIKFCHFNRNLF
jgi:transposase